MRRALFDSTEYTKWYVDDKGRVYSETTYKRRAPQIRELQTRPHKSRGYVYVRTTNKNLQLHRVVASAFIPNPSNLPQVNHKDGDKTNNKVSNLEWCTALDNMRHAMSLGLIRKMKKNEGALKYTNQQCLEVVKRVEDGMTYLEAGKIYNMPYSTVAHLMRGSRRAICE